MIELKSIDNITPINSNLIVKDDKEESKNSYSTNSGIEVIAAVDNKAKNRSIKATVIKVGSVLYDKDGHCTDLKKLYQPGDRILYYYPAGKIRFKINDEEYVLLRAEDVDTKFID